MSNKLFTTLMIVALAATSACSKKEQQVDIGTKNQILHLGNGTEPKNLDPHTVTGVPEHHIIEALFEGLIAPDPKDLSPVPGVAETWKISNKGTVYTFNLRKNAKWSNGDPVTAQDFVYSWKRILSPKLGAEYAYMLFVVKNAKEYQTGKLTDFSKVGITALDDHTLKVTLSYSTPYFLNLLQHYSTFPVHQKTVEKYGAIDERDTKWTRPGNLVGNGPFTLEEWVVNKHVVVKKDPTYWDAGIVRLNKVYFYPIESSEVEERAFRAGQIHKTNTIPSEKIAFWRKKSPKNLIIWPYLGTYYYRFNVTKKPMNDPRVRRALTISIDRDQITKFVSKAAEIPAYNFTPPNTGGYTPRAKFSYDPAKARELLAAAGYPGGKGFPPVQLLYNTLEAHQSIAEAVQQMWNKELGIQVELVNQEWKVYIDSTRTLNYDIARAGWIGDYPDPNTFLDMWLTGGGNNQTGWSNKEYDSLIAKAAKTADMDERREVFQKAEAILMEELPVMPIYTYTTKFLIHEDLKGWHENIQDWHPLKHAYLSKGNGDVVQKVTKND